MNLHFRHWMTLDDDYIVCASRGNNITECCTGSVRFIGTAVRSYLNGVISVHNNGLRNFCSFMAICFFGPHVSASRRTLERYI